MKKFIQNKLKDQKGLTLIELLAVIVILAIIAAIAIPAIGNIIENSRLSAVKADATNTISAANIYFTDTPTAETVDAKTLIENGYLDSAGELPISANGTIVKNVNPLNISAGPITFSGDKEVTFDEATVNGINGNTIKGSAVGESALQITATPTP